MKAIVQEGYGSPDTLELREVEAPAVGHHEVLVEVHAASVNALDWHLVRGVPFFIPILEAIGGPKHRVRSAGGTDSELRIRRDYLEDYCSRQRLRSGQYHDHGRNESAEQSDFHSHRVARVIVERVDCPVPTPLHPARPAARDPRVKRVPAGRVTRTEPQMIRNVLH